MSLTVNDYFRLKREGRVTTQTFEQVSKAMPTEKRAQPFASLPWIGNYIDFYNSNSSNIAVNSYNAMGIAAFHRCVELRATGMASLSLKLYKESDKGREAQLTHEVTKLLKKPNGYQTEYEWREWMESMCVGRGNGVSIILRTNGGKPGELMPIWNPDNVTPLYYNGQVWYRVVDERANGVYPATDIVHFKGLTWDNPLWGISPIRYHQERLGIQIAADKSAGATYKDGRVKFAISSSDNLNNEQQKTLKQGLADVLNDEADSFVLPSNGKVEQLSLSPADADYINNSNLTVQDIGRMFGVPNSMLNMDGSTKGSAEQEYQAFYSNTLLPASISREQQLSEKLLKESEKGSTYFKHIYNSTLRADAETRYKIYAMGQRTGSINANYIADREDNPRPDNGELFFIDNNLTPVAKIEELWDSKIVANMTKPNNNNNPDGNNQIGA